MKKRIYLFKSGTLKCQDGSLVYITKDGKDYIPIMQAEIIYVFGNCTLNKSTLQLLSDYKIKVYFFSYYGRFLGSYVPQKSSIGKVEIEQLKIIESEERNFPFQKEIILSSVYNMNSVLKYYQKKRHISFSQIIELEKLIFSIKNLEIADSKKLLIYEARSKQLYYDAFNYIILNKDFYFCRRSTYPPQDELNAIMSYGYAILYGIVETAIYTSNLQPNLGFIHRITKPNNSLKYDVADIFKPVLVDRLIFRMINKGQLKKEMFEVKDNGIYLSHQGSILFIEEFETLLKTTILVKNKKMSYRSIINREMYNIEKSIMNNTKYKGYRMEW